MVKHFAKAIYNEEKRRVLLSECCTCLRKMLIENKVLWKLLLRLLQCPDNHVKIGW